MAPRKPPPVIPVDAFERAATMLRVLAHAQRLRIAERLLGRTVSVGALAESLRLPPAVVSGHLANMRANGIVERERDGRCVHYRVVDPNAVTLIECLRRHCAVR